jgi:hypothetical protein
MLVLKLSIRMCCYRLFQQAYNTGVPYKGLLSQLVTNNLLRADVIRIVGTTCCESVGLVNLVTRWWKLLPYCLTTGSKSANTTCWQAVRSRVADNWIFCGRDYHKLYRYDDHSATTALVEKVNWQFSIETWHETFMLAFQVLHPEQACILDLGQHWLKPCAWLAKSKVEDKNMGGSRNGRKSWSVRRAKFNLNLFHIPSKFILNTMHKQASFLFWTYLFNLIMILSPPQFNTILPSPKYRDYRTEIRTYCLTCNRSSILGSVHHVCSLWCSKNLQLTWIINRDGCHEIRITNKETLMFLTFVH